MSNELIPTEPGDLIPAPEPSIYDSTSSPELLGKLRDLGGTVDQEILLARANLFEARQAGNSSAQAAWIDLIRSLAKTQRAREIEDRVYIHVDRIVEIANEFGKITMEEFKDIEDFEARFDRVRARLRELMR